MPKRPALRGIVDMNSFDKSRGGFGSSWFLDRWIHRGRIDGVWSGFIGLLQSDPRYAHYRARHTVFRSTNLTNGKFQFNCQVIYTLMQSEVLHKHDREFLKGKS